MQRFFALMLIASFALHLVGISLLHMTPGPNASSKSETFRSLPVEFTIENTKANRQIVQQDPEASNQTEPETAKFLSAKNNSVKKQTRAQHTGKFKNLSLSDLLPSPSDSSKQRKQKDSALSASRPTQVAPKPSSAGQVLSQTDDHLTDVAIGAETMLNTKEFVFYSYYDRIRSRLRDHWEPEVRERMRIDYRAGRRPASGDQITRVLIILDKEGKLISVQILGASGSDNLDRAAIQALKKAAPFPNPPKAIVNTEGIIEIRWDFVLES